MLTATAQDGPIYLFSPKHFQNSFNSEIGLTFFTNYMRSPQLGEDYQFSATQAYPKPIYAMIYGIGTITYEPQFRMIEIGHSQSLSFNFPMSLSLSAVDVRIGNGEYYKPISDEISYTSRGEVLGAGHAELGAMAAYNIGRNATDENIAPVGAHVAFGYNYVYGLLYKQDEFEVRSDYADYLRWGVLLARVGINFGSVGFSHTFGVQPTEVVYIEPNESFSSSVRTNVYQRFTMTFTL